MKRSYLSSYLAIYLVSTATLAYEIGLTRIFSLAQGYHFAFMVISIALMGIGAGGTLLVYIKPKTEGDLRRSLSIFSALFSISVVLSYITSNQLLFDPIKAGWSRIEFSKIFVQYLILSIPFVFSGMTIAAAMRAMSERVHRIYFSDMAGAATGCLLILIILTRSGGEGVVVVSATLTLLASLLFSVPAPKKSVGQCILLLAALAAVVFALAGPEGLVRVRVSPYRDLPAALNFPGAKLLKTLNSPSGRLDIVEGPAVRAAPGISLNYRRPLPPQRGFTINGGGLQTVTSPEGELSFLAHLPSSLAYRLKREPEVFVIDPGGGMEILQALENGAKSISGSETSSVVSEAMLGPLYAFSGKLYDEAEISPGYARVVLGTLDKEFDIITLPLTSTFGASSSGIRGLQEDYGLTVEAFKVYLGHLKPGGFVSVSSYLLPPPRGELKLLATVVEAIDQIGQIGQTGQTDIVSPEESIMAIRSWGVMTLVVKNGPIDRGDIETLKDFTDNEGFDIIWYPGMEENEANKRNRFPEATYFHFFREILDPETRDAFIDDYLFDIRATIDERPFFSQSFKMTRMRDTYESVGRKWGILIEGGYLLPWIFVQAALASALLIVIPLIWIKRQKRPAGTLLYVSAYFSAIGAGFMFLEIALIQKLMPVLGDPVYAVSVVLFTILLSTGAGSYLSGRLKIFKGRPAWGVLMVVPVIIFYLLILDPISGAIAGLSIVPKYVLIAVIFSPLGAAMGIPFPTGISILGEKMPEIIPWAWCVNGTLSVVSSVLVMIVAVYLGFKAAIIISACLYLASWLALRRLKALAG